MDLLPLYLILLSYPMGVAGQNILCGLAIIVAAVRMRRDGLAWHGHDVRSRFGFPLALSVAYVAWIVVATYLNPANPGEDVLRFPFGYLQWFLLPPFLYAVYETLSLEQWQKLAKVSGWIMFVWGAIALSQAMFGWKVEDGWFASDGLRPRGFYSHPLTFAYAALLVWPLAVQLVLRKPKWYVSWLLFIGTALSVYLTESRTVQAVALLVLGWNVFTLLKGRARAGVVALTLVAIAVVGFTSNDVSRKFRDTFSAKGVDKHQSDYPDDRLAFWAAHWEMIKERPVLGHGADIDSRYRAPYYEKIGLGSFEKKYEAHNMFIQITTNGGLIGLVLFLLWAGWYVVYVKGSLPYVFGRSVVLQTFLALAIGGMTQNAFEDAEVRLGLAILCSLVWVCGTKKLATGREKTQAS